KNFKDDRDFDLFGPALAAGFFQLSPSYPPEQNPADQKDRIDVAVARLQKATSVTRESFTYIVSVQVRSRNPVKAAQLAQAVSEAYLNDRLQAKYEAARHGAAWLAEQLAGLCQEVIPSGEPAAETRRYSARSPTA